ncbi:Serine/threonine-protein phosphatase 6 regulatory ankyrin repeat subunit B [Colletotrichum sp. SAR 10_96]|nr:Serine/threonine-protein phosphatase 6 regulatory ankyrin repeat subunit B [Colletotrichum sp. SAR 10_96]
MSDPQKYTIGWICALTTELTAAKVFLDEEHEKLKSNPANDSNAYTLGRIGEHNVVLTVLPKWEYGTTTAATVANNMARTFPNIRVGLMVGVGGGAPTRWNDIRLGDVVVSSRDAEKGGVFQYDYGRTVEKQTFVATGTLNQPPQSLLIAVAKLESKYELEGHHLQEDLEQVLSRYKRLRKKYSRPLAGSDRLYISGFVHPSASSDVGCAEACGDDESVLVVRDERDDDEDDPKIHYGLIASGNSLMKNADLRDKLAAERSVLCFEMEAAGLMNHFPCLVIRGICDYSDSHKNLDWQGFAAMMTAAYAKDILLELAAGQVAAEVRLKDVIDSIVEKQDQQITIMNDAKIAIDRIGSKQHIDEIKRWLDPPDPSTNANQAKKFRHPGTGEWFIESVEFVYWKSEILRHLWLHGLPGCGKTVLSSTIIEDLENVDGSVTLKFFFDFREKEKTILDSMLRSLIFQMYSFGGPYEAELNKLHKSNRDGSEQPSTQSLSNCLKDNLRKAPSVYLVIDALDECTTKRELLDWMTALIHSPDLSNVKLIVTSRPETDFQIQIPDLIGKPNCKLLSKDSINSDIRLYISARLKDRPGFRRWSSEASVLQKIRDELGNRANGMFKWAACQLDIFESCISLEEIEMNLKDLPQDLNQTYKRIMDGIPKYRRAKSILLLQFLVYSERPLTLEEAVDVLAVQQQKFKPEYRLPRRTEIVQFFPSLVSLIPFVPARNQGPVTSQLHLAHSSVKEYLLNHHDGFGQLDASVGITRTCLAYLGSVGEAMTVTNMRLDFPYARYAARFWMDFARLAESADEIVEVAARFLLDKKSFSIWTELSQPGEPWEDWDQSPEPTRASNLYFACLNGLGKTARTLIARGVDINVRGGHQQTALQAASHAGLRDVVQLLLDMKANADLYETNPYGSSLREACRSGYRDIAEILLDRGADPNGDYLSGAALQAVSEAGHLDIVRFLLDRGANPDECGIPGLPAIQIAAREGHETIVELLLDSGAEVNATLGPCGTSLQVASAYGHRNIVHLLLERGADVNAQGAEYGYYGSAIQLASNAGFTGIVRLLLEKGADPDLYSVDGNELGTAIQLAACEGHDEVVRILLDHGADVNVKGDIVLLLLTRGADVNMRAGIYGYALIAASEVGDADIVQLLLSSGANVDARRRSTPLIAALDSGHVDLARLLIDNGADVKARTRVFGNALNVVMAKGQFELVPLLLERRVELNRRGTSHLYRKTPYEIASERDDGEMLRMMENVSVRNGLELLSVEDDEAASLSDASSGVFVNKWDRPSLPRPVIEVDVQVEVSYDDYEEREL